MQGVLFLLAFQAWCMNLKKADLENCYLGEGFWGEHVLLGSLAYWKCHPC